jgi:hypothetical protein
MQLLSKVIFSIAAATTVLFVAAYYGGFVHSVLGYDYEKYAVYGFAGLLGILVLTYIYIRTN